MDFDVLTEAYDNFYLFCSVVKQRLSIGLIVHCLTGLDSIKQQDFVHSWYIKHNLQLCKATILSFYTICQTSHINFSDLTKRF